MKSYRIFFIFLSSVVFISGCAKIDPRQVDIEIASGTPELKETELSQALRDLGKMAEIYGAKARIMIDKISDNTGSAEHTKAEIPYDVTEMTISALNSIGTNVVFIPYRPDLVVNLKNLGYSNLENKLIPSAIITGGITEFDRGLETREDSANFGYETDKFGEEVPLGIDYMKGGKQSTAKITIDYNMIDISSMSGIPGIQTANTIQVHKGIGKKELGFTLFGPTIGLKGEVKKVEGRHAALRLLVQASVIQLVGKYLDIPFWKLLPGTMPDKTVEYYVNRRWEQQMDETMRITKIQELLILHGYKDIELNGTLDNKTKNAIRKFSNQMKCSDTINLNLHNALYYNIPIDNDTIIMRHYIMRKST